MKFSRFKYQILLIGLFGLFLIPKAHSQLEAKNWYFGIWQGMRFDSNGPVPIYNSAMYGGLGTSTISDKNGNLLFYGGSGWTATIWNKNHDTLKNGYGLYNTVLVPVINHP